VPIYFISMAAPRIYITNFDGLLVAIVLVVALASKLGSVLLGAKLAGMPMNRETWASAFGLKRPREQLVLSWLGWGRTAGCDR